MRIALDFLRQIGIDPIRFARSARNLPKFCVSLVNYLRKSKSLELAIAPTLLDFNDESGSAKGHYFWQDLIAARWIFETKPKKHLDVGSRIDGFVAHILTFMSIDILDVRPMKTQISGLKTTLGNAQEKLTDLEAVYESVSSLHSIEHFGLGRYGDPIDPDGHTKGLLNISGTVSVEGTLIVSFPVGNPRVQFNSQRIIHPLWPIQVLENFELLEFVLIPWTAEPLWGLLPSDVDLNIRGQCGLYKFKRRF